MTVGSWPIRHGQFLGVRARLAAPEPPVSGHSRNWLPLTLINGEISPVSGRSFDILGNMNGGRKSTQFRRSAQSILSTVLQKDTGRGRIRYRSFPPDQANKSAVADGHCWRKATMGSIFMARRAGKQQAATATAISEDDTTIRVSGSVGVTPKSRLEPA